MEREDREERRLINIEDFYASYRNDLKASEPELSKRNPLGLLDIVRIPSIAVLLENDSERISAQEWAGTNDDVRALIIARAQELETLLASLLQAGPMVSTTWEKAHSERLAKIQPGGWVEVLPGDIHAFFSCCTCEDLLWLDDIVHHRPCIPSFQSFKPSLYVPIRAPRTREIIDHLLEALQTDLTDASALLMSEERDLICQRCDPRIAEPMNFKGLVGCFISPSQAR